MTILTVHAGPTTRRLCPVATDFTTALPARGKLLLTPGDRSVPCQMEALRSGWRLHWVVHRLAAGESATYRLVESAAGRQPQPRLRWEALGRASCQLSFAEKPWLRLRAQTAIPQVELPDSDGLVLSLTTQLGDRRHVRTHVERLGPFVEGPIWSSVSCRGDWLDESGQRILVEETSWRAGQPSRDVRIVDVTTTLHARYGPWTFADVRAPGLLRVGAWAAADRPCLTQLGAWTAEAPSMPSYWCGSAGRSPCALFVHPDNPGLAPRWIVSAEGQLEHQPFVEAAQLGLLGAPPPLRLALGEALTWRYRLWTHSDPRALRWLPRTFRDFAEPPAVVTQGEG